MESLEPCVAHCTVAPGGDPPGLCEQVARTCTVLNTDTVIVDTVERPANCRWQRDPFVAEITDDSRATPMFKKHIERHAA